MILSSLYKELTRAIETFLSQMVTTIFNILSLTLKFNSVTFQINVVFTNHITFHVNSIIKTNLVSETMYPFKLHNPFKAEEEK